MALVEYSADDIKERAGGLPGSGDLRVRRTHAHGDRRSRRAGRRDRRARRGRGQDRPQLQTKGASHLAGQPILGELAYEIAGIHPPLEYGIYSSIDQEEFYRPGGKAIHEVEYFLKGLRYSVWFAQAVAKPLRWATVRSSSCPRIGCAHLRRGYHVRCGYPERRTHRDAVSQGGRELRPHQRADEACTCMVIP